jgi:MFS family permease
LKPNKDKQGNFFERNIMNNNRVARLLAVVLLVSLSYWWVFVRRISRHFAWKNRDSVGALAVTVAFLGANGFLNISLVWLLVRRGLGDGVEVSFFFFITSFLALIIFPVTGNWAKRQNPRKTMKVFLPLWLATPVLYSNVDQLWSLIVVRVLQEMLAGGIHVAISVQSNQSIPERHRREAVSFSLVVEFTFISGLTLLAAWLLDLPSLLWWSGIPLFFGLLTLLLVAVWLRDVYVPLEAQKQTRKSKFHDLRALRVKPNLRTLRALPWENIIRYTFLSSIPLTAALYGRYLPLVVPGMGGAILLSLQSITSAISGWIVIRATRRWSDTKLIQLVHGIQLVSLLALWCLSEVMPIMITVSMLLGWSVTAYIVGTVQGLYNKASEEEKGKQSVLNLLPTKLQAPIGHLGSERLAKKWGENSVWWIVIPQHVFAIAFYQFIQRKKR